MEKKQTLEDVFIGLVDQAEPGTERRGTKRGEL
jgi:hypothetical protein